MLNQPEVWLVVPDPDGNPVLYSRTDDENVIRAVFDKTAANKWGDVPPERWSQRVPEVFMVYEPKEP